MTLVGVRRTACVEKIFMGVGLSWRRVVNVERVRPVGDVSCLPHSDWLFGSALGCWDPIRVGPRTPRTPPLTSPLSIRSPNRVVDKDGDQRHHTEGQRFAHVVGFSQTLHRFIWHGLFTDIAPTQS